MTHEDLAKLFNRIVTGQTIYFYNESDYLVIKDPGPKEKSIAENRYENAYSYFLSAGSLSRIENEQMLFEKGLVQDLLISKAEIERDIKNQKGQLFHATYQVSKRESLTAKIEDLEEKLNKVNNSIELQHNKTAEYLATIEKYKYLIFLCTFKSNGNKFWENVEHFINYEESYINKLLNISFFNSNLTEKTIRKLARSEPWRSSWLTAKKTDNLFEQPSCFITDYQRMLVTWSLMYDSVYESTECPDDFIIENDYLLDNWFETQSEKRKRETSGTNIKNDKIKNSKEIGIVVNSMEEAQKVYSMNDKATQMKLQSGGHLKLGREIKK